MMVFRAKLGFLSIGLLLVTSKPIFGVTAEKQPEFGKLELATGNDFPPFSGEDLPKGGLATELVERIFSFKKIPIKISFMPWPRGFEETKNGTFVGTFPYSYAEDRSKDFYYSDAFYEYFSEFFGLKNSNPKQIKSAEDLKGKNVCNPRGTIIEGITKEAVDKKILKLEEAGSVTACPMMLKSGRVDYVPGYMTVFKSDAIKVFGSADALKSFGTNGKNALHVMFSKKHKDAEKIRELFNVGLEELKSNGEFKKIVDSHGGL